MAQNGNLPTAQQNNAVTKQHKPIELLKSMLNAPSVQEQFNNALHEHKDAFIASIIDLWTSDKALQGCAPQAVIAEALRAAVMKLPLNKALGFAYIVVFNNSVKNADGSWTKVPTPTFVPGYKGYIQLAMRTGQYRTINADVVYEGELLSVDKLRGTIDFSGKRTSDKVVGYFAYIENLNGFSKTLYMSLSDMAKYAKRYSPSVRKDTTVEQLEALAQSQTASKKVGWEGNFNDMAIKTCLRRLLSHYGYLSVEMQDAISHEIESSEADRNDLIAENANVQQINLDAASFEVVDAETGEIKNADAAAQAKEEDEPEY